MLSWRLELLCQLPMEARPLRAPCKTALEIHLEILRVDTESGLYHSCHWWVKAASHQWKYGEDVRNPKSASRKDLRA